MLPDVAKAEMGGRNSHPSMVVFESICATPLIVFPRAIFDQGVVDGCSLLGEGNLFLKANGT